MSRNVVLVAGVHGIGGRAAAIRWSKEPNTRVYGLSRRSAELPPGIVPIVADLLNPEVLATKVAAIHDITHVVFGAYIEKPTAAEKSQINVALLMNLLDVVESTSPDFRHILFYQGGKAYGSDLGPFKTPAREDDPRMMPPNFYYDQEDLLRVRQRGKSWHWTALRPEAIGGYAVGNPMNLGMVIAVYAVISKELGIPLRFPGSEAAYNCLYQMSSADILARAAIWAGTNKSAEDEIFNITNGDVFRWKHLWPQIAKLFGMEVAEPTPTPLASYMTDKAELWNRITVKYALQPISYTRIASWQFGDFIFNSGYDNISSTIKARQAGFHDCIDTERWFGQFVEELRMRRIIP